MVVNKVSNRLQNNNHENRRDWKLSKDELKKQNHKNDSRLKNRTDFVTCPWK